MPQFGRGRRSAPGAPDYGAGVATIDGPGGASSRGRRHYDPAWDDWNPPRRWPGVLISCVVVLGFFAVVVWHFRPHVDVKTHDPLPAHSTISSAYIIGTGIHVGPELHVATYRGTHGLSGIRYIADGRLVVVHAKCICQESFVISVVTSLGVPLEYPVNTSGRFNTVFNLTQAPGRYSLSVVGTGPWEVQLIEPQPTMPAIGTPFKYFSYGNDVIGPFSAANHYMMLRFFAPGGRVHVEVLDRYGFPVASPFTGRTYLVAARSLANLPNPYYLEINAAGFWQIKVQR
jgi:hypothetical protein